MQKLNAKKLIDFRGRSERGRRTFVNNLMKTVSTKDEEGGGGDYWIPSTSALANAWKENNSRIIKEKIESLAELAKSTSRKQTQDMYMRNLKMLSSYDPYDFSELKPKWPLDIKWVPKTTAPITIRGLFVQVLPNYVFTYKNKGVSEVGAVWFVARQKGFKKDELAVYAELVYKFLSANYRRTYTVNPASCIVLDVMLGNEMTYADLLNGKADTQVDSIIDSLKKFLK